MKALLFLLATISFVSEDCYAQKIVKEISNCIGPTCDSEFVFMTFFLSRSIRAYFPTIVFGKYYDKERHLLLLECDSCRSSFVKNINQFYSKAKNQKLIIARLQFWCDETRYLDQLSSDLLPVEAILFKTKATNHLFLPFLTHSGQSWTSLTGYQLYELNISYLNYTEKMALKELQDLHRQLKRAARIP